MDITVHAIDAARGLHLVGAGYSDSTIRVRTTCYYIIIILNVTIIIRFGFSMK